MILEGLQILRCAAPLLDDTDFCYKYCGTPQPQNTTLTAAYPQWPQMMPKNKDAMPPRDAILDKPF
jgi:hypothetical protein